MQFSVTYQGVAVMAVAFLLRAAGKDLPDEQVALLASDIIFLGGVAHVLYNRFQKGDIHWFGLRK